MSIQTSLRTLFSIQKGKCFYCGIDCVLPRDACGFNQPNIATREHIYPSFDIRRHNYNKIKMACLKCNREKGVKDNSNLHKGYDMKIQNSGLLVKLLNRKFIKGIIEIKTPFI